ncbi:NAD-dependent epimerase/dehydratase family protein [Flavobacteriaceae bacterium]|nr:NAD-dependent epimerase/dehydratase family protein [Flavobacteriaceae bacterium]
MKILVTGGAGFVGTNLIISLKQKGYTIVSIDNYSIGQRSNHIEGVTYLEMDANQIGAIPNDFDLIYHLAGLSRIQPSFLNPQETFISNTSSTNAILEFARARRTKVVYSGSSSKHHNPYQSPYALYKYLGEEICKMYKKTYNFPIEIVRFYNVYGPFEITKGDWAAVIGLWRNQVGLGQPITIVGDGEQRRDFTHVDDIVDGLIKIGFSEAHAEDAWELGSGKNYSLNEVYQMFKDRFGIDCSYIPNQNGNYRETLRENNLALEKLGWQPKDRLKSYIESL